MSDYEWRMFRGAKKRPAPEHGIKMQKAGTTWWGQRWMAALERVSSEYSNRLARGRTYARAGRTHDLVVEAGEVRAKVTGSRPKPYAVRIAMAALPEASWQRAIEILAAEAQFAAELLAGRMPERIDEAFAKAGASLFPAEESDLVTSCSCPDVANPCKHLAATHYVLGEALDRDPFLLFELRGRSRQAVLDALRAARSGGAAKPAEAAGSEAEIPHVSLGTLGPEDYERAPQPLPALGASFDEPVLHAMALRQLGAPPGWNVEKSPADLLEPSVRRAAERARRIALGEPEPDPRPTATSCVRRP